MTGGVIIRQIERVSLREDPAGEIGLGVGIGCREAELDGGGLVGRGWGVSVCV